MSGTSGRRKRGARSVIPPAEWLVAALGLCVVLATFGILLHSAVTSERGAPALTVRVDSVVPGAPGTRHVMFTVLNEGGTTAMDVQVNANVGASGAIDTRTLSFDFLPPKSARRGVLVVAGDVDEGQVKLRVSAYRE